jgi:hypothetical protein
MCHPSASLRQNWYTRVPVPPLAVAVHVIGAPTEAGSAAEDVRAVTAGSAPADTVNSREIQLSSRSVEPSGRAQV